ncbi:MAG: hypothetical protein ACR2NR_17485 [Solirubrobacteraceae bacterium]
MAERLKRASFARFAVGMAVLAFPLLAVGTAQAAIAGANPESTINRPDLVSATAITGTDVDFCFDKVLNNTGLVAGKFTLTGYRSGRTVTASSVLLEQTVDTTGECVRATFAGTGANAVTDIGQYTIGKVALGAVQTTATVTNPLADSTTLIVPASLNPTHNGTAGFTTGPDITGVLPDPTTNTITFTEDQAISTTVVPTATLFTFTRSGGSVCTGMGTPLVSGDSITVAFAPRATCPVSDAVRAGQLTGAVTAADDPGPPAAPGPPDQAIVPASASNPGTGVTSLPDLTSTILETGGQAVDYTFDKQVSVVTPTGFTAVLSNSATVPSSGASVLSSTATSTTIRVVFTGLANFDEYLVRGAVSPGAVTEVSPPNNPNANDSAPAGDNAGAFARGFTTAPDVFGATISRTNGVVTLGLDQRAFTLGAGTINLLDSTGNIVATSSVGAVTLPTQVAGPELITVQFSPGQAATATNVSVGAGALVTSAPVSAQNVAQILSGTVTSSLLHSAKLHKAQSKKQIAARKAQIRRQEKALRAKFFRHLKHA